MAHQLDFKITLWSNNSDALLFLEKELNRVGTSESMPPNIKAAEFAYVIEEWQRVFSKVDIHSTDINWDDDIPLGEEAAQFEHELTGKGVPQLTEAEFKRLYQGDWGEFDKAEAERIRNLLHDADKQTAWGQVMHDQIMEDLTNDSQSSDDTPAVE